MSKIKSYLAAAFAATLTLSALPVLSPAGAAPKPRRQYTLQHRHGADLIRFDRPAKHVPWRSSKRISELTGNPSATGRAQAVTGTAQLPAVLVEFSDEAADAANHPPSAYEDMLFKENHSVGGGSLRDYYNDVSRGLFDVNGQVSSSWLMMPDDLDHYAGADNGLQANEPNGRTLVKDATDAADPEFDFCDFDSDADGYVDVFMVIHAGRPAEEVNPGETATGLWSHESRVDYATNDTCADGSKAKIGIYTVQPEEHRFPELVASGAPSNMISVGVFCHEFGHALGLPDLYDIDIDTQGGVGTWDLMAGGAYGIDGFTPSRPAPLGAWTAAELGWSVPQAVDEPLDDVAFLSVDKTYSGAFTGAYRLAPGGDLGSKEYFLVEYRTPESGWSSDMPRGLVVWHINEARRTFDNTDNADQDDRLVEVVQADGLDELGGAYGVVDGIADTGDVFPGSTDRTFLDGSGSPNSDLRDGSASHIAIRNAGLFGDNLEADLTVFDGLTQPDAPMSLGADVAANGRDVQLTWTPSVSTDVTDQRIYRSLTPDGVPERVGKVGATAISFVDSSGDPGALYYYVVRAFNGAESPSSNQVVVQLGLFDLAPTTFEVFTGKRSGNLAALANKDGTKVTIKSKVKQGNHTTDYQFGWLLDPTNPPPALTFEATTGNTLKTLVYFANWAEGVYEYQGTVKFRKGKQKRLRFPNVSDYVAGDGTVLVAFFSVQTTSFKHVLDRVALALQ